MNPNTLLAAARLAYPKIEWVMVDGKVYIHELGVEFDPFGDNADAYALWKALVLLQHNSIYFYEDENVWCIECFGRVAGSGETFEEAMLKCVAALEAMK